MSDFDIYHQYSTIPMQTPTLLSLSSLLPLHLLLHNP
jgi:hypothetical protein